MAEPLRVGTYAFTADQRDRIDLRLDLLANGFEPLANVDKTIRLKHWPDLIIEPELIVFDWGLNDNFTATGLRCGRLIAIDFDVEEPELLAACQAAVQATVEPSRFVRVGRQTRSMWLYRLVGERGTIRTLRTGKFGPEEHQVEILGDRRQIGAFGWHTVGKLEYSWPDSSPRDHHIDTLPPITREQADQIIGACTRVFLDAELEPLKPPKPTTNGKVPSWGDGYTTVDDIDLDLTFDVAGKSMSVGAMLAHLKGHPDGDLRFAMTPLRHGASNPTSGHAMLDHKGDLMITDFASHTVHRLKPEAQRRADHKPVVTTVTPVGYDETFAQMPRQPELLIDDLMPRDVFGLVGAGGSMKTTLQLVFMLHIVLGRPLFEQRIRHKGPCVLLTGEDPMWLCRYRVRRIADAMELNDVERRRVGEELIIADVVGKQMRLVETDRSGNLNFTPHIDDIIRLYERRGVVYLTIDPLNFFGPGERHGNDGFAEMMKAGRAISEGLGRAGVCFNHHMSMEKATGDAVDQYQGRSAASFADNSRGNLLLRRHKAGFEAQIPEEARDVLAGGGEVSRLHVEKLSHTVRPPDPYWIIRAPGDSFAFKLLPSAYLSPEERIEQARADLEARDVAEEETVWQRIRELNEQGVVVNGQMIDSFSLPKPRDPMTNMGRATLRRAAKRLQADRRLIEQPLPPEETHGGRKTTLVAV